MTTVQELSNSIGVPEGYYWLVAEMSGVMAKQDLEDNLVSRKLYPGTSIVFTLSFDSITKLCVLAPLHVHWYLQTSAENQVFMGKSQLIKERFVNDTDVEEIQSVISNSKLVYRTY